MLYEIEHDKNFTRYHWILKAEDRQWKPGDFFLRDADSKVKSGGKTVAFGFKINNSSVYVDYSVVKNILQIAERQGLPCVIPNLKLTKDGKIIEYKMVTQNYMREYMEQNVKVVENLLQSAYKKEKLQFTHEIKAFNPAVSPHDPAYAEARLNVQGKTVNLSLSLMCVCIMECDDRYKKYNNFGVSMAYATGRLGLAITDEARHVTISFAHADNMNIHASTRNSDFKYGLDMFRDPDIIRPCTDTFLKGAISAIIGRADVRTDEEKIAAAREQEQERKRERAKAARLEREKEEREEFRRKMHKYIAYYNSLDQSERYVEEQTENYEKYILKGEDYWEGTDSEGHVVQMKGNRFYNH